MRQAHELPGQALWPAPRAACVVPWLGPLRHRVGSRRFDLADLGSQGFVQTGPQLVATRFLIGTRDGRRSQLTYPGFFEAGFIVPQGTARHV